MDASTGAGGSTDNTTGPSFGVAAPQLALPKGGGAIKGIGEKFGVNPVNGTGSLSIPIFTTPGRSQFSPNLSLSYNSGGGNSAFGFGWQLSVPAITRKTDKGLPRYFDAAESDVYILSAAEDLVPTLLENGDQWSRDLTPGTFNNQAYTVTRYRPRIEGLFARIERWRNDVTGDTFWKSVSKDNITSLYGTDLSSRIADPDNPLRVFSWLLAVTYDDRGNVIQYQYKPEDRSNVPSAAHEQHRQITANRYLKRILYGNRTPYVPDNGAGSPADWCFEVVFDYGEHHPAPPAPAEANLWRCRPDPFSNYRACFEVRTYRLCSRVLMFHHFNPEPGMKGTLVRSTDFHYSCDDSPPDPLSPIYTYLESATQTGYVWQSANGNYTRACLPPLEFKYTKAQVDPTLYEADRSALENLPAGVDGKRYQWVDLDSEGSPGILSEQAGNWFYKRNVSNLPTKDRPITARFEPVELVAALPSTADLTGGAQQLMDLAGDGRLSLVQFARPVAGYYERDDDYEWESFAPFASQPNIDWRDPNLRTVDLDGDGFADVLITEQQVFTWYPSWARAGFGSAQTVRTPFDEDHGPAIVFADGTGSVYLADMSGDGLKDLVRVRNGEICYWPNLGYGRFGAKITMDASPVVDTPDRFDQRRVRLADIDGSGATDLIYLGSETVRVWFNQSGNGWSAPQAITEFPAADEITAVSTVDLLGNGTVCLVWSSPLPADVDRPLRYIDLMGGQKPHLLVEICNNLGAETRIHYVASTKFYLADRAAGQAWVTRLSFPVHVVERVETYDWISRNLFVNRYSYHHGYFDGIEREFRGFGRVDQLDTEELGALSVGGVFPSATNTAAASYVPPVLTRTWYHTGAYPMGRRVSRVYEHEYYREPGLTDAQAEAMDLPDTVLPDGLHSGEIHEAIRSLKGALLRQEIYAQDGTAAASMPYSVAEKNYTITCLQPFAGNRHAVFFTHARESIDFHYERTLYDVGGAQLPDPRVTHNMVLAVDDYGNERQSVAIGYGRRYLDPDPLLTSADQGKQGTTLLTYTESTYAYQDPTTQTIIDTPDAYRTPAPAETRSFELIHISPADTPANTTNLFGFDQMVGYVSQTVGGGYDIPYEDLYATGATNPTQVYRRLIADTRTLYRKDDLSAALPLRTMESMALPYETYKLALTPGLVSDVYQGSLAGQAAQPLLANPATTLVGIGFNQAGYVHQDGDSNAWIPSGQTRYSRDDSVDELTNASQNFFLPCRFMDPFQFGPVLQIPAPHVTVVTYDADNLLVSSIVDAIGNQVTATNDYRVMQPTVITDANGNRTAAAFDALGLVAGTAVMGTVTNNPALGDSLTGFTADLLPTDLTSFLASPESSAAGLLAQATTRVVYDLDQFRQTRAANPTDSTRWQPVFAATIARETHVSDLQTVLVSGVQTVQASRLQIGLSYSDGFGREIQQKLLAEPGPLQPGGTVVNPRWLGSGWTIFNNKGKPVRKYEPFFSTTFAFEFEAICGVSPILFYDPIGRVVATEHPDQSWEKVVFDPWRQISWDVNDTVQITDPSNKTVQITDPSLDADVGVYFQRIPQADYLPTWYTTNSAGTPQQQDAAAKAAAHARTPGVAYFDTLGRTFLTVADNGLDAKGAPLKFATRTELDIQGYQRSVTDALNCPIMVYDYDMPGTKLHSNSVDAGERWMLNDVMAKPLFGWNSNGFQTRHEYDALRRPTGLYVTPPSGSEIQAENLVYGESTSAPSTGNLRGKVYQSFDAAGCVTNSAYDFKGNLLSATRQLLQDPQYYKAQVDWSLSPQPTLQTSETFVTSTTYDALNRPVTLTTPDGSVQQRVYNQTKLLQQVSADVRGESTVTSFVTDIDYDPKGRRLAIVYGNNARTAYTYDPFTFRLMELTTTRKSKTVGSLDTLQDLNFWYDPVGNITQIQDAAQATLYFSSQQVPAVACYKYDPIYRLICATGRELIGLVSQPQTTWNDCARMGQSIPNPNDGQAVCNYTESYTYDPVGNFKTVKHTSSAVNWTRTYTYDGSNSAPTNNRLTSTTVTALEAPYTYDFDGNLVQMPHLPLMQWNYRDELQATSQQVVNNGGTPEITYYVYDSNGQRVRKVTESQATTGQTPALKKERIYLGGYEIFRKYGTITIERQTLHVMDDKQRIALVETKTTDTSPNANPKSLLVPITRYQFTNHLGSALLELDGSAAIISYEEYYPYGSTSYQAVNSQTEVSAKRYRYSGKERDDENGFYYHGARYYAPWLGRWTACDPAGLVDGVNLYTFTNCNPVRYKDPTGLAGVEIFTPTFRGQTGVEKADELISQTFASGIAPKGGAGAPQTLDNLLDSINVNAANSGFVQSSQSVDIAMGFATRGGRQGGVVFEILPRSDSIIVNLSPIANEIEHPKQQIVAHPGGVAPEQVVRAFKVNKGAKDVLEVVENPNSVLAAKGPAAGSASTTAAAGGGAEAAPEASSGLSRAAVWAAKTAPKVLEGLEFGGRALGLAAGLMGAVNEANRTAQLELQNNRGSLNAGLMWVTTAVVTANTIEADFVVAGAMTMASGSPAPVIDAWDVGAGPVQHAAGELIRSYLDWGAHHGF